MTWATLQRAAIKNGMEAVFSIPADHNLPSGPWCNLDQQALFACVSGKSYFLIISQTS